MFSPFEIVESSLSCLHCEKMDLKIIQSLLRVQLNVFFLKNSGQFNCSGQTRNSGTPCKTTVVDPPTQYYDSMVCELLN